MHKDLRCETLTGQYHHESLSEINFVPVSESTALKSPKPHFS